MAGPAAGAQEADFAELMTELAAFRRDKLRRLPSDRALAKAAGVAPTTIGDWLRAERFPQQIDPLLKLVRAVRIQADRAALAHDPAAAVLLEEQRWRCAYQAEAERRAAATRAAVEAEQSRLVLERMRPGRPLSEVTDPFQLDVHHAIEAAAGLGAADLPVLPAYVPRGHDRRLGGVVARAAEGASQIAVLVGGSSTGKTRACWEALDLLRERDERWRVWHPIAPTRPDAALAELAGIGSYTVVWLNEAQFYLAPDKIGEQVAAGLRDLLRDPARCPVLVLATLWPEHWVTLTTRTSPDRHAAARELLSGHKIHVPDAFVGTDFDALGDQAARDPRLVEAAEHAADGRITQYLAGVPVLLDRYQESPPATRALIHAAMDVRRLGAGPHLPLAWLAEAAPGYLTDTEWDQTSDDWLQHALDYAATWCNGIPGILTPVKTGTLRNQRRRHADAATRPVAEPRARSGHGPLYRLADYLEQDSRRQRADQVPPIDFWTAAARHAAAADLPALGYAAWRWGLYRDAAQLHKHALTRGDAYVADSFVEHLHSLHPTDHRPAHHVAVHIDIDDPWAVGRVVGILQGIGAYDQVATLLARSPRLDDPHQIRGQWENGAYDYVTALAENFARDVPWAVTGLLESLRGAGAHEQLIALADRVAAHIDVTVLRGGVVHLLETLRRIGAHDPIATLLARNPATHVVIDDPDGVAWLLDMLYEIGAHDQVVTLADRAAVHIELTDPAALSRLLFRLWDIGAHDQATALAERAAAHIPTQIGIPDPDAIARLLSRLHDIAAHDQATALAERLPAARRFPEFLGLDDPGARFRFGREPDGSAAAPWTWEDLD